LIFLGENVSYDLVSPLKWGTGCGGSVCYATSEALETF